MTIETGIGVEISYVEETTRGETPGAPSMKTLRATQKNVNPSRAVLRPNEVQTHGWQISSRHGFETIGGSISGDLARADHDDFLALVGGASWSSVSVTTGSTTLDAVASGSNYTRSTGDFTTDGFAVGDIVTASGFSDSNNNGAKLVTAVASTTLTVVSMDPDKSLTDETGSGDEQIDGPEQRLDFSNTVKTWSIERRFTGLSTPQYQVFKGVAPNNFSLNVQPGGGGGGGLVSFSADLLGISGGSLSGTSLGSPSSPGTNDPFAVFDGALVVDETARAVVTGLNLQYAYNRSTAEVVGSKNTPDVFKGLASITGQMTVLLDDNTVDIFNLFDNETEFALGMRFDDSNGSDWQGVYLPRMKANGGDMDPPQTGPVSVTVPIEVLYDSTETTPTIWQRSNT